MITSPSKPQFILFKRQICLTEIGSKLVYTHKNPSDTEAVDAINLGNDTNNPRWNLKKK